MNNQNKNSDLLSKREKEVLIIYNKLNTQNQHKMQAIPVCKIPLDI
jgi:NAD+ synthase